MSPKIHPIFYRTSQPLGFSLVEVLITLSLLSGSYLVIFSTQQWLSTSSIRQEQMLSELLLASDKHELKMAFSIHESDE